MDQTYRNRVTHFLAQKSIAVAGYSTDKNQVANNLYKKFEKNGYQVFGVNPRAPEVTNIKCYPNLHAIPEIPDAVMICTSPSGTREIIDECIELGIKHAWIHCSFGQGSFDSEAIDRAEENGLEIIPRGCPHMFLEPDGFHACVKWFMNLQGRLNIKK